MRGDSSFLNHLGLTALLVGVALGTLSLLSGVAHIGWLGVGLGVGAVVVLGITRLLPGGR